jgi:D-alanyl-D-alanine carboxypeptidase (penicillin-binding protein 5/6)
MRRYRKLLILLLLVVAVITAGAIKSNSSQNKSADINKEKENETETETEASRKIVLEYPTVSSSYVDITSPDIKSPHVALLDVNSNQIVAGRDYNGKIYPASMTKVMTLIVAVENLKNLDEKFTFTSEMIDPLIRDDASRAGFDAGEEVSAKNLLYGLILPSGADAAVALSDMTCGSEEEFVNLMNEKCEELGLKSTHFVNASGLHNDDQYTTPVEMAMILEYAMQDETCAQVLSTYQYTTDPTPQHPEGILLTSTMFSRMYGNEVEGVTISSGKTGYTEQAKHCLVSFAKRDDKQYIAVTAGAGNRWYVIFDDFAIYRDYTASTQ